MRSYSMNVSKSTALVYRHQAEPPPLVAQGKDNRELLVDLPRYVCSNEVAVMLKPPASNPLHWPADATYNKSTSPKTLRMLAMALLGESNRLRQYFTDSFPKVRVIVHEFQNGIYQHVFRIDHFWSDQRMGLITNRAEHLAIELFDTANLRRFNDTGITPHLLGEGWLSPDHHYHLVAWLSDYVEISTDIDASIMINPVPDTRSYSEGLQKCLTNLDQLQADPTWTHKLFRSMAQALIKLYDFESGEGVVDVDPAAGDFVCDLDPQDPKVKLITIRRLEKMSPSAYINYLLTMVFEYGHQFECPRAFHLSLERDVYRQLACEAWQSQLVGNQTTAIIEDYLTVAYQPRSLFVKGTGDRSRN